MRGPGERMADETLYTIGELAELAGVTPRTIRYYTAEGLLPRPEARGQYALYGGEHLLRLQLIGRLKAGYLPLGAIKARIEHLAIDQLQALLAQEDHAAPPGSAAEYVARLLAGTPSPQLAEAAQPYQLARERPGGAQAAPQAQLGVGLPPAQSLLAQGYAQPAGPPLELESLPAPVPLRLDEAPAEAERWRRIALAPGIELHVREPLSADLRRAVDRIVEVGRSVLWREGAA